MKNQKGIYRIRNLINDKCYIGSTIADGGFKARWVNHRNLLRRDNHPNIHLQRAWNRYKEGQFIFEILEEIVFSQNYNRLCKKEYIQGREQYYLDTEQPIYNICKTAYSNLGLKVSLRTKKLMSQAKIGLFRGEKHPQTKLTIAKIGQIKWLLLQKVLSQQEIAQIFEVSQRAISDIKTGKRFNFSV